MHLPVSYSDFYPSIRPVWLKAICPRAPLWLAKYWSKDQNKVICVTLGSALKGKGDTYFLLLLIPPSWSTTNMGGSWNLQMRTTPHSWWVNKQKESGLPGILQSKAAIPARFFSVWEIQYYFIHATAIFCANKKCVSIRIFSKEDQYVMLEGIFEVKKWGP